MHRVVVVGCGYVGSAAADLFHARGWEVEAWTSSSESAAALQNEKPFAIRAVDITAPDEVARAKSDCDAVIQCVSSRGGTVDDYRRLYLEGARNLAAAFPDAPALFTSSTSVYAQREGEWVTETSAAEPARETARVLRETEDLVLARGGIATRLAGIYGPGRSALLRKFLAGTAVLDGAGTRFINQVHRDDIAAALVLLVDQRLNLHGSTPEPSSIYNVADSHPFTERECYEWLAAQLSRPMPPASSTPVERKRGNSNKRVSAAKLLAAGWAPRFPDFAAGMRDSVLPNLAQLGA